MSDDLTRELQKVYDVLVWVDKHLQAEAEMNAAAHMNPTVRPTPLAALVGTTVEELGHRLYPSVQDDA